jgi:hypothetical protein
VTLGEVGVCTVLGWWALIRRPEHGVVDALGVGLHVTREPPEQLADGRAGLSRRVLEEPIVFPTSVPTK